MAALLAALVGGLLFFHKVEKSLTRCQLEKPDTYQPFLIDGHPPHPRL